MKINDHFITKNLFTLIAAPVASGKTRSIVDFYNNHQMRVIFVTPLRALGVEVAGKFSDQKNIYWLGDEKYRGRKDEVVLNFLQKKKAMLILTVELMENEFLELLSSEERPILFVLDEFHLFYSWGESFRPILHDMFLGMLMTDHPIIALSATINSEVRQNLERDLSFYQNKYVFIDEGNHQLYRRPSKIHFLGGQDSKIVERKFVKLLKKKKSDEKFLMFCQYRQEVFEKVEWAKRNGFKALGCVGGEVGTFQNELNGCQQELDCIFSTQALSHGVNLPEINKVFINYQVGDFDFWLQMIGRGGRQGSSYEVYSFDNFMLSKKEQLKQWMLFSFLNLI